jgi:hypothetical protein
MKSLPCRITAEQMKRKQYAIIQPMKPSINKELQRKQIFYRLSIEVQTTWSLTKLDFSTKSSDEAFDP